jgi:putative ABC transport system substrate-binding protein
MRHHLSRRAFAQSASAASLALLAGCLRLPEQAQPARVYRLGFLGLTSREPWHEAFWEGLRELGYLDGQNITVETRFAEGRADRLPELADALVHMPVDLIMAAGTPSAMVAKQATATVPIVFAPATDPIANGLVASLAKPGGNATGLANITALMSGKRLELLKETVPGLARVAVLANPSGPGVVLQVEGTRDAAQVLGLRLQSLEVRRPDELASAFDAAAQEHAEAMTIIGDSVLHANVAGLADLAAQHRLPAVFPGREFVEAGGLLAYGPNQAAQFRRAAYYVDRILKGTKPADLPVEQPREFDFVLNARTARALGLEIPQQVMQQVTEVIE